MSTVVKHRQIREAWVAPHPSADTDYAAWERWFAKFGVRSTDVAINDGEAMVVADDFAHTLTFWIYRQDDAGCRFVDPEAPGHAARRRIVITVDDEIPAFPA